MKTILLKDAKLRIIGRVEVKDNGDKVLKNDKLQILGYYDARTDTTKDAKLRIIGHGDILTNLL
jgi:hypothetical protein